MNKGDRIAQLIIEKISETEIEEVDCLDETERGKSGFGSTGISLSGSVSTENSSNEDSPAFVDSHRRPHDPAGSYFGT